MKKNKLIIIVIAVGLISMKSAKCQSIEIGQSAEQVMKLVELRTKDHNKIDSYGNTQNSHWSWEPKYYNGILIDVVQCYQKQYFLDLKLTANYCEHYLMENNELSCIMTQYENISVEKITENYDKNYSNKLDGLYFSDDYQYYDKIYLGSNGLATKERRKTNISNLPTNIQKLVSVRLVGVQAAIKNQVQRAYKEQVSKQEADIKERQYTLLACEDISEGLFLVRVDIEHSAGEMNHGYGKKLYGYIDEKGAYVIYPKYAQALSFNEGYALVAINDQAFSKWQFINPKGENVFNKEFADARSFSEGLAAVRMYNGLFGFIDKTGNYISKPQYNDVGDFKEGLAKVKLQDKWGFIDKTGKEIVVPQFTDVSDFSDGLALVTQFINYHLTAYSYVDKAGNVAIKLAKEDMPVTNASYSFGGSRDYKREISPNDFNDGLTIITKSNGSNVFIDKMGKVTIKPKNPSSNCHRFNFYQFINGYAITEVCGQFGLINKKADWVVKPIFDDIGNFHEQLAKVKLNGNWGFVNTVGQVVINKDILKAKGELQTNSKFDFVSDFTDGVAIVKTRDKYGYIDKVGNWVIKPELSLAEAFKNGIARVKFADRKGWNYIDKTGKILFPDFL